jgi:hypothetical protein
MSKIITPQGYLWKRDRKNSFPEQNGKAHEGETNDCLLQEENSQQNHKKDKQRELASRQFSLGQILCLKQ